MIQLESPPKSRRFHATWNMPHLAARLNPAKALGYGDPMNQGEAVTKREAMDEVERRIRRRRTASVRSATNHSSLPTWKTT